LVIFDVSLFVVDIFTVFSLLVKLVAVEDADDKVGDEDEEETKLPLVTLVRLFEDFNLSGMCFLTSGVCFVSGLSSTYSKSLS
jgi:hypothetical protein